MTQSTAFCNSVKLRNAMWGEPRQSGHGGEAWQNVVHWRRDWQATSVFLPWEPYEQYDLAYWALKDKGKWTISAQKKQKSKIELKEVNRWIKVFHSTSNLLLWCHPWKAQSCHSDAPLPSPTVPERAPALPLDTETCRKQWKPLWKGLNHWNQTGGSNPKFVTYKTVKLIINLSELQS